LAEPDHHGVFLAHELHPEPRAAAIAPLWPGERAETAARRDAGDARERITELRVLRRELRGGREVLQCAAPTDAKVRAARRHPLGGGLEHLEQLTLIVLAMRARAAEADELTRERCGDECRLATVHHPLAFVCQALDTRRFLGPRRVRAAVCAPGGAQAPSPCQARRNSAK